MINVKDQALVDFRTLLLDEEAVKQSDAVLGGLASVERLLRDVFH